MAMTHDHRVSIVHGLDHSGPTTRPFTLLILSAGGDDWHPVFTTLFQRSMSAFPDQLTDIVLTIKTYDIRNEPGHYPEQAEIDSAAALLITGSPAAAYGDDSWIHGLSSFISFLHSTKPELKLIGICFGHQIIAQSLGGKCELNEKGLEIGVRSIVLTPSGRALLGASSPEHSGAIRLHQFHSDHVTKLPPGFTCIGSTPDCHVHGMVYPETVTSLADARVVTLQGHPEHTPEMVLRYTAHAVEKGAVSSEEAEHLRYKAGLNDDGLFVGAILLRFIVRA